MANKFQFPENTEEILKNLINQNLTYKQLYKAFGIPYNNSTNSRLAFIKNLSLLCDIEDISHKGQNSKFLITKIYDNPLLPSIHPNNKFQAYVEKIILTDVKNNNIIYVSMLDLLEKIGGVNNNFRRVVHEESDYREDGWIVYEILEDWCRLRLQGMVKRGLIRMVDGFRLSRSIKDGDTIFTISQNVNKDSELEQKCWDIYSRCVDDFGVNKNWNGWLPPDTYIKLRDKINAEVCQQIPPWEKMKKIMIIEAVADKDLINKNIKEARLIINKESQRKIRNTTRLHLGNSDKEKLIKKIIKIAT